MKFKLQGIILAGALALTAPLAWGGEKEDLESLRQTTLNLIRLLVKEGVLTKEKAEELIRQAQQPQAAQASQPAEAAAAEGQAKPGAKVVRVPYVPEFMRKEIKEELRQEVITEAKAERWTDSGPVPEWVNRFQLKGDVRVRYENDLLDSNNAPPQLFQTAGFPNVTNTQNDNERLRLRARVAMTAKVADNVNATVGLATGTVGSTGNPVSTNQTLGSAYFARNTVGVDLAYIKVEPYHWMEASGGRIPNPWFGTDLLWAPDLNFDGAAMTLKPKFQEGANGFFTIGAFPLQQFDPTTTSAAKDKWLYGSQGGLLWKWPSNTQLKLGIALYDYRNVSGIPNTGAFGSPQSHLFDATAPQFTQKGNTPFQIAVPGNPSLFALASKFKEVDFAGQLDLASLEPNHILLDFDFVKNIGFDHDEILARTGLDLVSRTKGYQYKLTFGRPRLDKRGDWQVFSAYKYLESDAVLDAFVDPDFHLGGTNAKGYVLGGSYGVAANTWLTLKYLSADPVTGPPLAIDVLQLDLNTRF